MADRVRVVEYAEEGFAARLIVAAATVRMGIERTLMQHGARQLGQDDPPQVSLLRRITWPDLVAATVEGQINGRPVWDLTFDEWLDFPEPLVIAWERAVYELNPHWLPPADDQDGEGKAPGRNGPNIETGSGSASSRGTRAPDAPAKTR